MDINQAYPSKYLTASDLYGQPMILAISTITVEKMRDGTDKPVLYFQNQSKGFCLNKTNANMISNLYGSETNIWMGRQIELFPTQTEFGGDIVDCIRVRAPQFQPQATPQQQGNAAQTPVTPQQAVNQTIQGQQTENPNPHNLPNPSPDGSVDA